MKEHMQAANQQKCTCPLTQCIQAMSAVILLSKADLKQGTEACSPPSQTAAGISHMFHVGGQLVTEGSQQVLTSKYKQLNRPWSFVYTDVSPLWVASVLPSHHCKASYQGMYWYVSYVR